MTIGPSEAAADGDGKLIEACTIGAQKTVDNVMTGTVTAGKQELTCAFSYTTTKAVNPTLVGSTIVAKIYDGACGATEDNDGVTVPAIAIAPVQLSDDDETTNDDKTISSIRGGDEATPDSYSYIFSLRIQPYLSQKSIPKRKKN